MTIENTRDGSREDRVRGDWQTSFPVDIGADSACKIQLVALGVTAHHARYLARGHHRYVEAFDEGAVVQLDNEELRSGSLRRIDYRAFTIGPFQLTFGERSSKRKR